MQFLHILGEKKLKVPKIDLVTLMLRPWAPSRCAAGGGALACMVVPSPGRVLQAAAVKRHFWDVVVSL